MNNFALNNKYFKTKELGVNLSLLEISLPYFDEHNTAFFSDLLYSMGYRNLIIDISKSEYLDRANISILIKRLDELKSLGLKIRLVVSEEKPRIAFSTGNPISKVDVYLNLETALKDLIN